MSHKDHILYPTGSIEKESFCHCCKRFNARYATASALVIHHNQVLLIKRNIDPMKGWYSLPGGYISWDETMEDCCLRELEEETGYTGTIQTVVGVFSDPLRDPDGRQNIEHCYLVINPKKTGSFDNETKEVKWFSLDNLPSNIAFDHRKIIEHYVSKKM